MRKNRCLPKMPQEFSLVSKFFVVVVEKLSFRICSKWKSYTNNYFVWQRFTHMKSYLVRINFFFGNCNFCSFWLGNIHFVLIFSACNYLNCVSKQKYLRHDIKISKREKKMFQNDNNDKSENDDNSDGYGTKVEKRNVAPLLWEFNIKYEIWQFY